MKKARLSLALCFCFAATANPAPADTVSGSEGGMTIGETEVRRGDFYPPLR